MLLIAVLSVPFGTLIDRVRKKTAMVVATAATTGAVSYTHLRAHETVLDLVCRLLLEKKKTTLYTFNNQHPTP